MAIITLGSPKKVKVQEELSKEIISFEVLSTSDSRESKTATALVRINEEEIPKSFQLWSAEEWDKIGAYSDDQVDKRVEEVINALS